MGAYTLGIAIAIPVVGGIIISNATRDSLLGWYTTLRKPAWNPPGAVFGPVWAVLYTLLGMASYQVWAVGGFDGNSRALTLYGVQLALNFLWPIVFFNWKKLFLSAVVNVCLLVASVATCGAFYKVRPEAGQLLLPYLAWLAFANLLNIVVWRLNPHAGDDSVKDATIAHDETVVKKSQVGSGGVSQKDDEVVGKGKPVDKGDNYGPMGPTSAPAAVAPRQRFTQRISNPKPTPRTMLPRLSARRPATAGMRTPQLVSSTTVSAARAIV